MAKWLALICAEFVPDERPRPKMLPPTSRNIWELIWGGCLLPIAWKRHPSSDQRPPRRTPGWSAWQCARRPPWTSGCPAPRGEGPRPRPCAGYPRCPCPVSTGQWPPPLTWPW
eukprot:6972781-Heterocapsa_arctica.AAC.1